MDDVNNLIFSHLKLTIPISIEVSEKEILEDLYVYSDGKYFTDFILNINGKEYKTHSDDFEYGLINLQIMLPRTHNLKVCLSCKYSHYFPGGNDTFGTLYCFREIKSEITKVSNKSALLSVMSKFREKLNTTQETYVCSEFIRETITNWSYKDWNHHVYEE